MRIRWSFLFVAVLSLAVSAPASAATTWALLVGVSKYETPQIASLRFPSADAAGIREALVDPQIGALPPGQVRLLADSEATRDNILGAVDRFLKPNVKAGDQVIVFLAGHGVTKGVGAAAKGYLLPTDVKGLTTAALESSAVDLRQLSNRLGELPASQFVLFVDACREDPTPGRGVKGNLMNDVLSRGVQVVPQDTSHSAMSATFFACAVGERAYEDPDLKHGVFTYYILDGIRSASVPRKPDGAVELGRLASYVQAAVKTWAEKTTNSGIYEVEQTPQCIRTDSDGPLVLVRVKRTLQDAPPPSSTSTKVVIGTFPEGAAVTINGTRAGAGPVVETMGKPGEYRVRVEAPGYQPVERTVKVLEGYEQQVIVRLEPTAGVTAPAGKAGEFYQRSVDAETRQQWEVATGGYKAVIDADPKFAPAYERLAELYARQGRLPEAIAVLVDMVAKTPPAAHGYSLLSRAYSTFAERERAAGGEGAAGDNGGDNKKKKRGGLFGKLKDAVGKDEDRSDKDAPGAYVVPKKANEALALARKAAAEALKLDKTAAEAHLATGFALTASRDGKTRREALDAFGQAVFLEPKDAVNHYGLGFGLRSFAQELEGKSREAELKRAINSLQEAVKLRPDYYEAHRELGLCYHLLDDSAAALHEYELAEANRGSATDEDEVASVDVAMSSIHKKEASRSTGAQKQQHEAASEGYYASARELSPNLTRALEILDGAGLRSRLIGNLPTSAEDVLGRLKARIPRPNLPGIPGLPF
jgi:tetratricopeptide (TPR) repeat protein